MKICTIVVGNKYAKLANNLRESLLPFDLHIFDESKFPKDAVVFKDKFFNYNCKRHILIQDQQTTNLLFIDADSVCNNQDKFLDFCNKSSQLEPGVYSTYTWSSYGFHVPKIKENILDKSLVKEKVMLFNEILNFSDKELLDLQAPGEWILFYKFIDIKQKNDFYKMWGILENRLLASNIKYLGAECFSIAMSAMFCKLPVKRFNVDIGIKHK